MRVAMMIMTLAASAAALADGDPKTLAAPPPPPPVVEAPTPPPPPVLADAPAPLPVLAPEPVSVPTPPRGEGFGADTRYWVATQIYGNQSVKELRPVPGEVGTHVFERYLKSFDYPIPETFKREGFDVGGGSGGGASTR